MRLAPGAFQLSVPPCHQPSWPSCKTAYSTSPIAREPASLFGSRRVAIKPARSRSVLTPWTSSSVKQMSSRSSKRKIHGHGCNEGSPLIKTVGHSHFHERALTTRTERPQPQQIGNRCEDCAPHCGPEMALGLCISSWIVFGVNSRPIGDCFEANRSVSVDVGSTLLQCL
jgi:hypothetical protein